VEYVTNLGDRIFLRKGFPRGGLMIAGGLDLGLVGLVLTRVGNRLTGVAMLLVGLASAVYALLHYWSAAHGG